MHDVLRGVKVLEVAQWWFTPSAGAILREWGAEVIKVEHPVHGDPQRGLVTSGMMPNALDINYMVEQSNRGKRSIGLDIGKPQGREILDRMIDWADVFLTNFLPDSRAKYRIDVEDVRARNARIIYARGHGAGHRGPEREKGGFDAASFWARGGVAYHLTADGAPAPVQQRPAFGDGTAALSLAGAVSAALFGRERHGEPSVIDVSLLGTALWVMSPDVVAAGVIDGGLPPMTREAIANPIANCYRTGDGRWLWFAMLQSDRYWPELCERLERPDLITDERFSSASARAANLAACMAELEQTFARQPLAHWQQQLADVEGVWSTVQSAAELHTDPQVLANGYLPEVDYGSKAHRLVANPAQFDEQPPELTPAPEMGQHTEEILLEFGSDWEQIAALKEAGVVN
ncbi:MAG TPA: CoA transferase [Mycobacteriales bacterium]|nr:CoA transferase [Mycobacteriales bacterium]